MWRCAADGTMTFYDASGEIAEPGLGPTFPMAVD